MQDEIIFFGHPNVQSFHTKTMEITKDENLTLKGDCIIGVRATKACADLHPAVGNKLMKDDSFVKIEIIVGSDICTIIGNGDGRLTLKDSHDIVIRKTNFVCPRTLSIKCDRASSDIPRKMVEALQSAETKALFCITIE